MSASLEELLSDLDRGGYTALTQEQMQEQAARRYQSVYAQRRQSARQSYEASDAALARQMAGLQASYDQERRQSRAQTQKTYSEAGRQSLSRGMQRSSFGGATLANINLAGDRALEEIGARQTADENGIAEQRTLLSRQLAQQLSQLDTDQRSDELAYIDELTAREYERAQASRREHNEMAMQLYEYRHQLEQEAREQARWEAEFNARYGGGGSSGRSSRKRTTRPAPAAPAAGSAGRSNVNRNQRAMDR